jgi:hypothetical protein
LIDGKRETAFLAYVQNSVLEAASCGALAGLPYTARTRRRPLVPATAFATSAMSWEVKSLSPGAQRSVIRIALAPAARAGSTAEAPLHFGPSSLKPKKKLDPARATDAVAPTASKSTSPTNQRFNCFGPLQAPTIAAV